MSLTIGIDPRIRARRIAVRRAEGRRRLKFLLGALLLVTLAVAAWALSRSPLLDLDHVRIEGVESSRADEVEAALGLERGTPLADLDLGELEAAVEALPWVRVVDASRDWPGTVRVDVVQRVAVASVPDPAGDLLVDSDAVVIGRGPAAGLPRLVGAVDAQPGDVLGSLLPALAVVAELPDDLRPWVDAVTLEGSAADVSAVDGSAEGSSVAAVGLALVGGAVVEMGPAELLADKVAAVRAVLDGTDLTCVRVIDVTVADLATIVRDPACGGGAG